MPNAAEVVTERLDGLYAAADDGADATLALEPGTHRLDVVKAHPGTSHIVPIGSSLPWTLTFTNTGTGFLTLDDVVDTLPEYLEWDYSDPIFSTSDGGTLSTDVTTTADSTGKEITFSWPSGGERMSPGEVFTITISLALTPGLSLDEFTSNTFVVTTDEELAACTNTSGNGEGTVEGLPANECGTTDYVQPQPGGAISASKWVRGEVDGDLVDGAVNLNNPQATCQADAEGYTRTPCAAYTTVGATDDWKVEVLNSGTVGFDIVSMVDPLPRSGDRLLATGGARNTTFAPVLIPQSLAANSLPAGATLTLDVTTSMNPCVGTGNGSAWFSDLLCNTTADWTPVLSYGGDWADVTGMRVTIDFTGTEAGEFAPGERLDLHYQTRNDPATDVHPELAPIDVPHSGGVAWNQLGAVGTDENGREYSVAPVTAGVTLVSGDLGLQKAIEGVVELAPVAFDFRIECTVAGAALVLPDAGVVTLTGAQDWKGDIRGIPLGTECTVRESGPVGEYGEDSRRGDAQTLRITTASAQDGSIPAAQTALITNVYVAPPVVPPVDPPGDGDLPPTGLDAEQTAALVVLALLLILAGAWFARRRGLRGGSIG